MALFVCSKLGQKKDYNDLFKTRDSFTSVRSAQNHYSGGIIVYVKKGTVLSRERIFEDFDVCLVLKMDKEVFSLKRDLILGAVYISPEGSISQRTFPVSAIFSSSP